MTNFEQFLLSVASIATSLTIVLTFISKYVWQPWERKKAKEIEAANLERLQQEKTYQEQILEIVKKQMNPITQALEKLNKLSEGSQHEIEKLAEVSCSNKKRLERHEERLDDHGDRILVLETKTGIEKERTK